MEQQEFVDLNQLHSILDKAIDEICEERFGDILKRRLASLRAVRRELSNQRIKIGVIGVTSSGKSTFLNALIGESLLPEESKPTSNVLVSVRKGNERRLSIHLDKGRKPIILQGDSLMSTGVAEYISEEKNPGNRLGVSNVVLETPSMLLGEQYEIVDTPGLDAFGLDWHQELTLHEFVPQADIIVYMTSIRNPFKKQDLEALNYVLENNQRVVFVMSGKGLERADTEGGQIILSRDEKLKLQMERLKRDAAHCKGLMTAGYAVVDSKDALCAFHQPGSKAWTDSGFPDVLRMFDGFRDELVQMALASRSNRAMRQLQGASKELEKFWLMKRGDKSELERHVLEQKERLSLFENTERQVIAHIEEIEEHLLTVDEVVSAGWKRRLTGESADQEFQDIVAQCDRELEQRVRELQKVVSEKRDHLQHCLQQLGLDAPRITITDVRLDGLPVAQVQEKEKVVERTERKGWFEGVKFWPHDKHLTETTYINDVASFRKDLKQRIAAGIKRVEHYVSTMQRQLSDRYLVVLRRERESVLDALNSRSADLPSAINDEESLHKALIHLAEIISDLGRLMGEPVHFKASEETAATTRTDDNSFEEVIERKSHTVHEDSPKTSLGESSATGLMVVINLFRDLQFHNRFLDACRKIQRDNGSQIDGGESHPLRIAVFGLSGAERLHLANLLLHRLHNPVQVPSFDLPILFVPETCDNESDEASTFTETRGQTQPSLAIDKTVCIVKGGSFLQKAHILLVPDDDVLVMPNSQGQLQSIVRWAEISIVLLDGPRIGTALNDLYRAPYKSFLGLNSERIIYALPNAAKFDDKVEDLMSDVVPKLFQEGPYGRRPLFIYENYDVRYTDYLELVEGSKTETEFVRRWRQKKLSLAPPFQADRLEDRFSLAKASLTNT